MGSGIAVTERFIKDLERLPRRIRKKFEDKAERLYRDPLAHDLQPKKLNIKIGNGKADVYENRIDRSYRLIWTTELGYTPLFRLGRVNTTSI
jgi:mRNA-degrading endonuclease RelE of RelBE toxin-antitoxin system